MNNQPNAAIVALATKLGAKVEAEEMYGGMYSFSLYVSRDGRHHFATAWNSFLDVAAYDKATQSDLTENTAVIDGVLFTHDIETCDCCGARFTELHGGTHTNDGYFCSDECADEYAHDIAAQAQHERDERSQF